jgi:hypothetical protein
MCRLLGLLCLSFCFFTSQAFSYVSDPTCSNLLAYAQAIQGQLVALPRPLPSFKQDVNGKCGPTSLGIALGYFGKVFPNPLDPFSVANQMVAAVINVSKDKSAARGMPLTNALNISIVINGSEALSDTARAYGLYSVYNRATLAQMASYVADGEVVLVHWWMGPGTMDQHWSAIQNIGASTIELRDPWPENPSHNVKALIDFYYRSWTGIPGVFSVVRISDHPIVKP